MRQGTAACAFAAGELSWNTTPAGGCGLCVRDELSLWRNGCNVHCYTCLPRASVHGCITPRSVPLHRSVEGVVSGCCGTWGAWDIPGKTALPSSVGLYFLSWISAPFIPATFLPLPVPLAHLFRVYHYRCCRTARYMFWFSPAHCLCGLQRWVLPPNAPLGRWVVTFFRSRFISLLINHGRSHIRAWLLGRWCVGFRTTRSGHPAHCTVLPPAAIAALCFLPCCDLHLLGRTVQRTFTFPAVDVLTDYSVYTTGLAVHLLPHRYDRSDHCLLAILPAALKHSLVATVVVLVTGTPVYRAVVVAHGFWIPVLLRLSLISDWPRLVSVTVTLTMGVGSQGARVRYRAAAEKVCDCWDGPYVHLLPFSSIGSPGWTALAAGRYRCATAFFLLFCSSAAPERRADRCIRCALRVHRPACCPLPYLFV